MADKNENDSRKILVSDLMEMKVFTKHEGKYLGKITKITFNHKTKKVASFIIKESFWNSNLYQVMVKNIVSIGEDIIYIESIESCRQLDKNTLTDEMTYQNIDGHRIVTDEGKFIGMVDDIAINIQTFLIKDLIFKDNSKLKVEATKITLGQDEIIVPNKYEQQILRESKESVFRKYIHFRGHEEIADAKKRIIKEKQDQAIRENLH